MIFGLVDQPWQLRQLRRAANTQYSPFAHAEIAERLTEVSASPIESMKIFMSCSLLGFRGPSFISFTGATLPLSDQSSSM
jgi:hypothetical protein